MDERGLEELIEEKSEFESHLEEILDVDGRKESWGFEDLSLTSGEFGEIVSTGALEKDEDGYRVADRDKLESLLKQDETQRQKDSPDVSRYIRRVSRPTLKISDNSALYYLAAALGVVVLLRFIPFSRVFRDGIVAPTGNDPYYYRYLVEQTMSDIDIFFGGISDLSQNVAKESVALVLPLAWISLVLGGGQYVSGVVMSLYPVLSAVAISYLVYLSAVKITDDRRVGIASVLVLALTYNFLFRTALGYPDRHALDLLWLSLTFFSVVSIADSTQKNENQNENGGDRLLSWSLSKYAVLLGIGLTGQLLTWENSPVLMLPAALYLAIKTASDIHSKRVMEKTLASMAVGAALSLILVTSVHLAFGWARKSLVAIPPLFLVGIAFLYAVTVAVDRFELKRLYVPVIEVISLLAVAVLSYILVPSLPSQMTRQYGRFMDKTGSGIVETKSIWTTNPLDSLGLFFVLGVVYLVYLSYNLYREEDSNLALFTYAWYFLILSSIQRRFTGMLSIFIAILAAVAFKEVVVKLELAREKEYGVVVPDRDKFVAVAILFLLVSSYSLFQLPVLYNSSGITDTEDEIVGSVSNYSTSHDLAYPRNYVLTKWSRSRMYNYFVNGNSGGSTVYDKRNYIKLLRKQNPRKAYSGDYMYGDYRKGFLVIYKMDDKSEVPPRYMYSRLFFNYGSRKNGVGGLGHYRLIYSKDVANSPKVYKITEGYKLNGTSEKNQVDISKKVDVQGGYSLNYTRKAGVENGTFSITVPYPGRYNVGNRAVTAS